MELTLQILQFILSISILVVLHEFGHYLPAKWFGVRREKFMIFFDPYFSLFSMKKINGKWQYRFLSKDLPDSEKVEVDGKIIETPIDIDALPEDDWRRHPESTKWGIGWLPMGGYVKMSGIVDESMDTLKLKEAAKPWEFRSKPAWQRLIILLGGVTVNFFLAWLIYSALSYFNGEHYTDLTKFESGISVTESGEKLGFQEGDKIISIDGKPAERLEKSMLDILFSKEVVVERNGKEVPFRVNEDGLAEVLKQREAKSFLLPKIPTVVDSIDIPSASAAGLLKGDEIVAINGRSTPLFKDFVMEVQRLKNTKVSLDVMRNNEKVTLANVPVNAEGRIGFSNNLDKVRNLETNKTYTAIQSIPRGFERTIETLTTQIKQFRLIFNSKIQGYKSVGGPIAIVKMMPIEKDASGAASINWDAFWSFTALFSVWLAFLNLIPIPGLDGGHAIFTLWELIMRKPVPQKILEHAQTIGVIFLLILMVLIFGSDIYKVIVGKI